MGVNTFLLDRRTVTLLIGVSKKDFAVLRAIGALAALDADAGLVEKDWHVTRALGVRAGDAAVIARTR
jgi:hypothetical protein